METSNNILEKIGNRRPFQVPENYFEQFTEAWEHRVETKQKTLFWKRSAWRYAAAIVLIVAILGPLFSLLRQQKIEQQLEEYELYLYSQIDASVMYDYYNNE